MTQHQRAFTLVELSIVLVILGLLIGGVLTGQSLIRASELRSVGTQFNQYVTATQTFRDKYFALPGDMLNAQSYWGIQDATPANCVTSASTDTKTCNGNGNGIIDDTNTAGSNERFRYWQHLANAGLIEGSYNGVQGSGGYSHATAANSPKGKLGTSLWWVTNWGTQIASTLGIFDGTYGNIMQFGGPTTTYSPLTALFKPEELYNIDMKMDDGKPATGKVVIRVDGGAIGTQCTTGSSSADLAAEYKLTTTTLVCNAIFRQAF